MRSLLFIGIVILPVLQGLAQNSVLSEGSWSKLSVNEDGIYKIDYRFLRNELNWDTENIDPRTIKIYGNGGGMLPQRVGESRPFDLIQNSIFFFGEDDGELSEGDYLLFYAESPHDYSLENGLWKCETNLYSDKSYYFITYGGSDGLRISESEAPSGSFPEINSFPERIFLDENEINIGKSGRTWYSNFFGRNEYAVYSFETPDAIDSLYLELKLMGISYSPAEFQVEAGGVNLDPIFVPAVVDETYARIGSDVVGQYDIKHTNEELTVRFVLNANGETRDLLTYTDMITITYDRALSYSGNFLNFSLPHISQESIRTINMNAEIPPDFIWEIHDPRHPKSIEFTTDNSTVSFNYDLTGGGSFIALNGDNFPTPEFEAEIPNQNLKSLAPKDGLIITHPDFLNSAKRLASFHAENDGLDILTVTTGQVYNEFSSGRPDITAIRDIVHYFWQKNSATFKYLLLFGDTSFDYKDRVTQNTNFVPIYQSRQSLEPVLSYCSDDYYGFMEDDEGIWSESVSGDHTLEIGIGRIPVISSEEAEDVISKIIRYATSTRLIGEWKNHITYVVDDGDNNLHMGHAEDFGEIIFQNQPKVTINKLYLDIFEQEVFPSYETSTSSRKAVENAIEDGTFMVNYIGHGNEEQWMAENVFDRQVIKRLTNRFKLPVFMTATCEFGRYDDPTITNNDRASSAELLLKNPDGGAIALLTTSRPVFASSNYVVNEAFHTFLFEKENRLGDLVRKTKNASLRGPRNRNFSLLGDPFLRLAYPGQDISFDEINGRELTDPDTLSALEEVTIRGSIRNSSGMTDSEFNGTVTVQVYDTRSEKQTRGQENSPFTYQVQENVLFKGQSSVNSGEFLTQFILPKNISYSLQNGKIQAYAWNEQLTTDAAGASEQILIGGSNPNPVTESNAPEVYIYFNDSSFTNGDRIGTSSLFIARIRDESGINITGLGISQDITLTLSNGDRFVLNSYYSADLDTYQQGTIIFPLRDLEPGKYQAQLKLWDIHNNPVESTVSFIVSDRPKVRLFNVRNYPNPLQGNETVIRFDHDRPGEGLKIDVVVYNSNGRKINTFTFELDESTTSVDGLELDLGSINLNPGIYFYHLRVTSTLDNANGEQIGKMIKIN